MKTLLTSAETIINAAITASSTDLGDVKNVFVGGGFPPQAQFPALVVGADRMRKEHKRATGNTAVDSSFGVQYDWFINIIASTGVLRTSFEQADDILDELLPIIDANYTWGSVVDDTNYNGDMEYSLPEFRDTSLLTFVIAVPLTSNYRWGRT